MIRKCHVTVLLTCFFLFSVQAAVKEGQLPFDSLSNSRILSGKKKQIEKVVDTWIAFLMEVEEGRELDPSSLKIDYDFNQLLQFLKETDNKGNSALITIADLYLSEVEKIYKYMLKNNPFYRKGDSSSSYDFSVFFDYAVEDQRMDAMVGGWYIAFVFLSLAGFSSSNGKGKYIASIERFQILYDFFREFSDRSRSLFHSASRNRFFSSSFEEDVGVSDFFKKAIKFQKSFDFLHDTYFELILPAFMKLSWVRHDMKYSNHPEVLFRYGRILHKAYGTKEKGLSYISRSAERGYMPAVQYLGEYYLNQKGTSFYEGERLMIKFLEGSKRNFPEKIRVIRKLFSLNMMRGDSISDSLQRGIASLKKSCPAAFPVIQSNGK